MDSAHDSVVVFQEAGSWWGQLLYALLACHRPLTQALQIQSNTASPQTTLTIITAARTMDQTHTHTHTGRK